MNTLRRKVVITNPQGFHMRPQKAFADLAKKFQSTVTLCKGGRCVNGKKPFDLLEMSVEAGTELEVVTSGSDAEEALEALSQLLALPSIDEEAHGS
jgi:phosphotransferase system HPr (HPr) family protein